MTCPPSALLPAIGALAKRRPLCVDWDYEKTASRRMLLEECEWGLCAKGLKGSQNGSKWLKIGSKWLKMAQNRVNMAQNGSK